MINKKGQGMSINAVVLIVLAVIILVVLVLGFIVGWNKILPWLGESNNLESLSTTCSNACAMGSTYNYCSVERDVKDGVTPKFKATCQDLATKQQYISRGYGIATCESIACPN